MISLLSVLSKAWTCEGTSSCPTISRKPFSFLYLLAVRSIKRTKEGDLGGDRGLVQLELWDDWLEV